MLKRIIDWCHEKPSADWNEGFDTAFVATVISFVAAVILVLLLMSLAVRADVIDLPPDQRQHNDSGSDCVHASITNLLRIAGDPKADEFWKRFGNTGEDSPPGLAHKLDSMGIKYTQTTHGNKEMLLQSVKDGRGAAVGLHNSHMVNFIGGDDQTVVLAGNMNDGGKNKTETWAKFEAEFDGWVVILAGNRPTAPTAPITENKGDSKVRPTDWPYCCVCDVTCGNAGGSATLLGVVGRIGIAGTAAHVVEGGTSVKMEFPNGYKTSGTVIGRSSKLDLAAIRLTVKEGMTTPRGIRAVVKSDTTVLAVGYPFYADHLKPHWTQGKFMGYEGSDVHFDAHPFIHSGFSGGMLISADGYYLGSTNGYGTNYSFAASGENMVRFFSKWIKQEEGK